MSKTNQVSKKLLRWYQKNRRDLPWRQTKDPYKIWISEIMLQQTQVNTVIPYYLNWIKVFPNIKSLAKSSEQKVLKQWEGLGYYSRARNIHFSSKEIIKNFKGKFPKTFSEIVTLKGIGRYTGGAIGSIAYDLPTAIVDGNVERILSRIFWIKGSIKSKPNQEKLWKLAQQLVPSKKAGDFNQAMMELGATVCSPISPACDLCPVNKICEAKVKGKAESLPVLPVSKITKRFRTALIVKSGNKILVQKRVDQRLLKGLWELPGFELKSEKCSPKRILGYLGKEFGLEVGEVKLKVKTRYGITRYQVNLQVWECETTSTEDLPPTTSRKWLTMPQISKLPFVGHQKKVLIRI